MRDVRDQQARSLMAGPGDRTVDAEPFEERSPDFEGADRSMDPGEMTLEDVMDAEEGRADIPGETIDGLDEMEEEIRRQAEDIAADLPRRQ